MRMTPIRKEEEETVVVVTPGFTLGIRKNRRDWHERLPLERRHRVFSGAPSESETSSPGYQEIVF